MNRRVACLAIALLLTPPASAETLREAIEAAYESNPTLAAARERQQALEETPEQARAGARLTASVDGTIGYDRFNFGKGGTTGVTATLPIWTGGRVGSAVRAAESDVAAGAEGTRDTEAAVLQSVVEAYAELLYDQHAVDVAQADIELLESQVQEAEARFKLGQATRTDVAQLEAQRAQADATLADAQATLTTTSATYRAVVGHDPEKLDAEVPPSTNVPPTLAAAREAALQNNPVLLQRRQDTRAAAARVDAARAERAPTLSLGGGYGYSSAFLIGGSSYESQASAGVQVTVPLLTGGLVRSHVRQADATYRATRLDIDAAERDAIRSTDAAWANLVAAHRRMEASARAVSAAELALKGVRAEYAYNLRTTLDILVADESLRAAQLALARSRSDALIAQAVLLRAAGRLGRDAFA